MSYEQKEEQIRVRFLDCDCTCCGIRQRSIPSMICQNDENQFEKIVKNLTKPRYGLDCQCFCDGKTSSMLNDPCTCSTIKTKTTPIRVQFGIDTGVKPISNLSTFIKK